MRDEISEPSSGRTPVRILRSPLVWLLAVLLILPFLLGKPDYSIETMGPAESSGKVRVGIDAGHGGIDPGKVGVHDVLEKDINLAIAFYLKEFLEQNDIEVVMTRTEDKGLYEESDSHKKTADLRRRLALLEEEQVAFTVSIHQNSFSGSSSKGAQVFYYDTSEEGKKLSDCIQRQIVKGLQAENHRQIKANKEYYMLKNSKRPLVIVECGFLSNPEEEQLLTEEHYQEKMAWAIHLGVMEYLNGQDGETGK